MKTFRITKCFDCPCCGKTDTWHGMESWCNLDLSVNTGRKGRPPKCPLNSEGVTVIAEGPPNPQPLEATT